jgi:hypothetical protein
VVTNLKSVTVCCALRFNTEFTPGTTVPCSMTMLSVPTLTTLAKTSSELVEALSVNLTRLPSLNTPGKIGLLLLTVLMLPAHLKLE